MNSVSSSEVVASLLFALAIGHTFIVKYFLQMAAKFPKGSAAEKIFHILGEVELVFVIWAIIDLIFLGFTSGFAEASNYLTSRNFTEPAFVFVIMTVCASRPILQGANIFIEFLSGYLPFKKPLAFFISTLIIGPILGSFITEPAAMTVTALILLERFFKKEISMPLKYAILGLLFVNISIGGTLTSFAAPPVLMVARVWNWDLAFMLSHFGWKAFLAVTISTSFISYQFRKEFMSLSWENSAEKNHSARIPLWIYLIHFLILVLVVIYAHDPFEFAILFLIFICLQKGTAKYHEGLQWKSGMLVALFLAGLVILGGPQKWWLEPLLAGLESSALYFGAMALTALTDNAALTYLGSQVSGLSDFSKYALVAGSVVGGGLTVIANAPNPAGYGILNSAFGKDGINPGKLFIYALPPTLVAALCFWFL